MYVLHTQHKSTTKKYVLNFLPSFLLLTVTFQVKYTYDLKRSENNNRFY
jgi:hypothetical protein